MTKRECLEGSVKWWNRLAETGLNKRQTLEISPEFAFVDKWLDQCACCEFCKTEEGLRDCTKCPMASVWGSKNQYACLKMNTPYRQWDLLKHWEYDSRKQYAMQIALDAQACLDALPPEDK